MTIPALVARRWRQGLAEASHREVARCCVSSRAPDSDRARSVSTGYQPSITHINRGRRHFAVIRTDGVNGDDVRSYKSTSKHGDLPPSARAEPSREPSRAEPSLMNKMPARRDETVSDCWPPAAAATLHYPDMIALCLLDLFYYFSIIGKYQFYSTRVSLLRSHLRR